MIAALLDDARARVADIDLAPTGLILPHAGYIYSGSTAALGYALLERLRGRITRVVLLGPCHRVYTDGLALPDAGAFETPLGSVPVLEVPAELRRALPQLRVSALVHAEEHSLEVHLPFLQAVLGDFALVPVVVGEASPEQVAELLQAVWGGEETLVVVSSDLSHYLPYEAARERDRATCRAILALQPNLDPREACGAAPINGLLLEARRRGLAIEQVDLRNSGDTAGDRDHVVGYAAFALHERR